MSQDKGQAVPHAFFKQAVGEVFEFLTTDFGFSKVEIVDQILDCTIKYRNRTTGIDVYYELNSQLSVDLIKTSHQSSGTSEEKPYDLLLLMELRRPDTDAHKFYGGDKEWTDDRIKTLLREYANFLREGARDVLSGDFSVLSTLRKLGAQRRRQSNKELFGTYCGESPRFSTRPTLDQVFADIDDFDPEIERLFGGRKRDKLGFRIYEAHWDHQYSAKEIAEFLHRSEGSIIQALDDLEG